MNADMKSGFGAVTDGAYRRVGIMATVYQTQRLVVKAFYSNLYEYLHFERIFCQNCDNIGSKAVGTCSHRNAADVVNAYGFFKVLPQTFAVCTGKRLEIGKIPHVWIFPGEKPLSVPKLISDGSAAEAISRSERPVVAVNTASGAESAVAVGTGTRGIDRQFLNLEVGENLGYVF